jgi:site-specific DNA recombinase
MSTWRGAQSDAEGILEEEAREVLAAPDRLWTELFPAEQARIIQLLVERVEIGTDEPKLRFQDRGLAHMVAEVGMISGKGRKAAA